MTDLRQAAQMALDALERALETSMRQALKARIPECGEFAGIAQDVDWAATALRTALAQQQAEPIGWLDGNDKLAEFMHRDLKAEHDKRGSATPREFTVPVYTAPPQQQAAPDRRDLQAAGTHPAPCARHCEAKAFAIEIRSLKSQLKQQAEPVELWLWIFEDRHGDRYTHKNLFYTADEAAESARICGVKAIKKIDSSKVMQQAEPVAWMVVNDAGEDELWWHNGSGNGKPLYTTTQQRKPLTDEMRKQMKEASDSIEMRGAFANGWLSAEAAHGIKEGT